jgi:tRNA(Ser,Leu) C12 N-acetylase TAN1/cbb3-type cytochrome oxidase subunit 3
LNSPNIDNYGCIQNGIVKLKNGNVLISVGDQIYEYTGPDNNLKNPEMKLDFSGFKVNNQLITKDKRFKINKWNNLPVNPIFEHFENNLEFNFNAVNYHENSSVNYSWKLEGSDKKWSDFSDRKFMNYTNLPAGLYTFKVKAVDEASKNVSVIQYQFEILTPFYKSIWFIFLVILLIGTIVYFVFTSRVKKIKRETAEKIINFQKLAESELKALRAQMNPHFMFNTINSIQEIVLGNDDKTARIYFADFAKMMRMILENSTQKLISLEKEIDFLNLYLSFEKVRFKDKFEIELVVDDLLETATIKLPSMLIQPFIENAINHGLLHKENHGRLQVKFEEVAFENEAFLKCTIEDNGIGREAAMSLNKWKEKDHQSISTTVNSERIELLNTIMENKKFYLFITDLKDGELATGTKVELLISI